MATSSTMNVLELYSGIGGMHWALKESSVNFEVVMAVDINTTANKIYKKNFPSSPLHSFGIEKLTLKTLNKLNIDAILMSPPCQPFTRVGKKQDNSDIRTQSFLHILSLLKQLERKPKYILIENVKGFEISHTHELLIECLKLCQYTYQEFLLTPLQFGIPNSRLRFYLIAKWKQPFVFQVQEEIMTALPSVIKSVSSTENGNISESRIHHTQASDLPSDEVKSQEDQTNGCDSFNQTSSQTSDLSPRAHKNSESLHTENIAQKGLNSVPQCVGIKRKQEILDSDNQEEENSLRNAGRNMRYCEEDDELITSESTPLSEFMEEGTEEDFKNYLLSDKELRMFVVMDVVFPELKKSTCFTKRYGHYVEGAGSVVQMTSNVQDVRAASQFKTEVVEKKNSRDWGESELGLLRKLKLRYFTPREVANLLSFPPEFDLPKDMPKVQLYRVLGNSLNVHVVAELIKLMTLDATCLPSEENR